MNVLGQEFLEDTLSSPSFLVLWVLVSGSGLKYGTLAAGVPHTQLLYLASGFWLLCSIFSLLSLLVRLSILLFLVHNLALAELGVTSWNMGTF